jgi:multicomponent Na+:H+ antiporter subunit E
MIAAAVVRGVLFFGFWLLLMPGAQAVDLAVGVLTAALAAWASLSLLPPAAGRLRLAALLAYLPHFLWQSVAAGIDVARRALDPRLPLNPGFVRYRTAFPPGAARDAFASITSLLPGSVPADEDAETLLYHCLDTAQPLAAQLAAEERVLAKVFVAERDGA